MLHFLFHCKPHQNLMDLLLCLLDYPFSIIFSTFTQFFITFIQTFYEFLFVELLNPLCLVLDTDLLQ